jgi:hypothetical protein
MKDRLGRQRNLAPTGGTLPASLSRQFVGAPVPAPQTRETLRPAAGGQILLARFFVGFQEDREELARLPFSLSWPERQLQVVEVCLFSLVISLRRQE